MHAQVCMYGDGMCHPSPCSQQSLAWMAIGVAWGSASAVLAALGRPPPPDMGHAQCACMSTNMRTGWLHTAGVVEGKQPCMGTPSAAACMLLKLLAQLARPLCMLLCAPWAPAAWMHVVSSGIASGHFDDQSTLEQHRYIYTGVADMQMLGCD